MFDFFSRDRKNTNVTCEQQFLQIMEDKDWHCTDDFARQGVIDFRTAKYRLKLQ